MKNKLKNKEIAKWWEVKRKVYNIILIAFSIFVAIGEYRLLYSFQESGPSLIMEQIILLIIWIFGANIFYCLGAGFEITCRNYKFDFTNKERWALFVFGILVSLVWTILWIPTP